MGNPRLQQRQPPAIFLYLLVACVGGGLICGCAPRGGNAVSDEAPSPIVWPGPPTAARFVYEVTLRSSADVRHPDPQQAFKTLVTGRGEAEVRLSKPYAVAAARGVVYVSDTVARRIHAFDVPRGRYFAFGLRREGLLRKPLGLAVDDRQHVYVADASARRAVMFDHLGLYRASFGSAELLQRPTDVAVSGDGSRIYVVDVGGVDSDRHQVVAFNAQAQVLFRIHGRGRGPGQLNLPVAAAVGPDGTLYVLDAGNFRVQVFDAAGKFLRQWGGVGRGYGQFARPKSIAVDGQHNVYVADAAFGNVQIFDANGTLLLPIGRASRRDAPGQYALLSGVAVDRRGFVYLLDQVFNKIDVLRTLRPDR